MFLFLEIYKYLKIPVNCETTFSVGAKITLIRESITNVFGKSQITPLLAGSGHESCAEITANSIFWRGDRL